MLAILVLAVLNVACNEEEILPFNEPKGKFVNEELVNTTGELKDVECLWSNVYYPIIPEKWALGTSIGGKECLFYPQDMEEKYKDENNCRFKKFKVSGSYKYIYSYEL
ncbi:MAG: hypothetical protein IJX29_00700 [Bacteroides sp.]|nr:hypothetical protein [Bacteroides sp.]